MAKKRKPGRPGKNAQELQEKSLSGEKKLPERDGRLADNLRENLKKRNVQKRVRQSSQRGK